MIFFASYICTAGIIDDKKKNNVIDSEIILEVWYYFASFVNSIIIFTSIFLFDFFYLYLIKKFLSFVLKTIIEKNKIEYKSNSKVKIIVK